MRSSLFLAGCALLIVAGAASAKDEVRTLEAIQIEGEIAIPQVLFITSRDHPRFRDQLRERYHKSAVQIGQEASWPTVIRPLALRPEPLK